MSADPEPLHLSHIAAAERTFAADRALATVLAAVAGGANAGGFILLGQYTSHMTGYLSQVADQVVLGNLALVAVGMFAIVLFVLGAAVSAGLINWARLRTPSRQYALPIGVQGVLFLLLGGLGGVAGTRVELGLLCFIMGLQNATITKISGSVIRTTHATGMLTDAGIEIGRLTFARLWPLADVPRRPGKLALLVQLLASFLGGGFLGALGYGAFGVAFSLLLAVILLALAIGARR